MAHQPLTATERLALAAAAERMADEIDNNPHDELQGFQDELRNRARMLRSKATLVPGTRVTTPHGPGAVTETPSLMASGATVKVRLDNPITASGEARYGVDEVTVGAPLPKRIPGATLRPALPKRTPGVHTGVQDAIDRYRTTPTNTTR